MRWILTPPLIAATVLLAPGLTSRADDFVISVKLGPSRAKDTDKKDADERTIATKHTRQQPVVGEQPPRLVFEAKKNEPLLVRWSIKHTGREKTLKNVLVHFFVDKEKKAGDKTLPKLGKDVVHEGALTLDFKPGDAARGEFTLKVPEAGAYLIRVETRNLLDQHGHEHYAALDLVVE